jgi:Holliday junction resolvasome RuvABC endonuclease subunit
LCWAELGARTVKKILTGNGNADKKEVREVVTMKFPKLKSTDAPPDAYDAVGVGVVAYQRDQWSIPRKNIYSDKNWNNNV